MTEPTTPDMTDPNPTAETPAWAGPTPPPTPPVAPPEPTGGSPAHRGQRDRWQKASDAGSLVWGVILLAVGGWFFVEQTLGYDLPRIDWGTVWPIVLIVVGGWIVLRAAGRRSA
jgi:hypothetical protein